MKHTIRLHKEGHVGGVFGRIIDIRPPISPEWLATVLEDLKTAGVASSTEARVNDYGSSLTPVEDARSTILIAAAETETGEPKYSFEQTASVIGGTIAELTRLQIQAASPEHN